MSLSLSMLLGFAGWTLLVLITGVGVRRWSLILSGEAEIASFSGHLPEGSPAYLRAVRAHANCVENLPVFATVVLVAALVEPGEPLVGRLATAVLAARIGQSLVHMLLPETNRTVAVRFALFLAQVLAMIAMGADVSLTAAGARA